MASHRVPGGPEFAHTPTQAQLLQMQQQLQLHEQQQRINRNHMCYLFSYPFVTRQSGTGSTIVIEPLDLEAVSQKCSDPFPAQFRI